MSAFTKKELMEMWKRSPERQYNIAFGKILEAIRDTKGDIAVCFSGGKDSSLLLDMFCEAWKTTQYSSQPVKVCFANTTNETAAMLKFVDEFIPYIEKKHSIAIDFSEVRPPNGVVWVNFIRENGTLRYKCDHSAGVTNEHSAKCRLHGSHAAVSRPIL